MSHLRFTPALRGLALLTLALVPASARAQYPVRTVYVHPRVVAPVRTVVVNPVRPVVVAPARTVIVNPARTVIVNPARVAPVRVFYR